MTPPISTQSSPALQLKASDLPIVQEEVEDDKSVESDGEERKGVGSEKERLGRKDSHPVEGSSDRGDRSEEGVNKGNESASEDNCSPKIPETTPPAHDSDGENSQMDIVIIIMHCTCVQ